jgi:RNA polymerase sigma factor (sigma-70 family)
MREINDFPEVNQVLRSTWLMNYVNFRIYRLELSSYLSGEDVIQHVVECLTLDIQSGKKIEHPIAWAKLVSERFMTKQYRKNRNSKLKELSQIEYFASLNHQEDDFPFFDSKEQLHQSMQQLKPASREIIRMRFFQELHWNKIAEILSTIENKQISVETARKRGERAIKELRQIYLVS